jgi:hypothetical protein
MDENPLECLLIIVLVVVKISWIFFVCLDVLPVPMFAYMYFSPLLSVVLIVICLI